LRYGERYADTLRQRLHEIAALFYADTNSATPRHAAQRTHAAKTRQPLLSRRCHAQRWPRAAMVHTEGGNTNNNNNNNNNNNRM